MYNRKSREVFTHLLSFSYGTVLLVFNHHPVDIPPEQMEQKDHLFQNFLIFIENLQSVTHCSCHQEFHVIHPSALRTKNHFIMPVNLCFVLIKETGNCV